MDNGTLYAEQLMNEFESRFATADFSNRVSYFSGLKQRILHRDNGPRHEIAAPRTTSEPS